MNIQLKHVQYRVLWQNKPIGDLIESWCELAKRANWSAKELAKNNNVSLRTLQRYFLSQVGKSPKAWLLEQRQREAMALLQSGCSVKEVACKMGYKHASTFSREFRKRLGYSPSTATCSLSALPGMFLP